jgi:hypothetical protein
MASPSTQDPSRPAIAMLGTGRMGAPIAHKPARCRLRGVGLEPHRVRRPGPGWRAGRAGLRPGGSSWTTAIDIRRDRSQDAVAGRAGSGTRLKLFLNNWLASQVEAVAETIALTEALGIDPHLFVETIADGPLG